VDTTTRIQLCGRLVVRIHGERRETSLPGRKGRLLFAYLALNRERPIGRGELLTAVSGEDAAPAESAALSVVLSKLRRAIGDDLIAGRSQLELALPDDALVDVEAALEGVHRAESHIAAGEWAEAWGPAAMAAHIPARGLLPGLEASWLDDWRRRLDDVRVRGLESLAASALGLGGPALPVATRAAGIATELAPFRENAYRLLMESQEAAGNVAEALLAYERLRLLLRDELGVAPGQAVQAVYRRLLGAGG
jgi:DNA-binding SARP family transcriptional activator